MGHDGCIHRRGNFGGAAGLGAVTDHTAHVGNRVGDGVTDVFQVAAMEPGDGSAAAGSSGNRTAKGRQTADKVLLIDGDQVAQHQCTIQLFIGNTQMLGVFDDRQGNGQTLVAAARIDDYRQAAAAHTGIGGGSCTGLGTGPDGVLADFQQGASDLCAKGSAQTGTGDGGVQFDLTIQQRFHGRNLYRFGKFQNICHVPAVPVSSVILGFHRLFPEQHLTVLFNPGDQGMTVDDGHRSAVLSGKNLCHDVQIGHIFLQRTGAVVGFQKGTGLLQMLGLDGLQHFQLPVGIAADGTQNGGSFHAF